MKKILLLIIVFTPCILLAQTGSDLYYKVLTQTVIERQYNEYIHQADLSDDTEKVQSYRDSIEKSKKEILQSGNSIEKFVILRHLKPNDHVRIWHTTPSGKLAFDFVTQELVYKGEVDIGIGFMSQFVFRSALSFYSPDRICALFYYMKDTRHRMAVSEREMSKAIEIVASAKENFYIEIAREMESIYLAKK